MQKDLYCATHDVKLTVSEEICGEEKVLRVLPCEVCIAIAYEKGMMKVKKVRRNYFGLNRV